VYILERKELVRAPLAEVFKFFEDPGNLQDITPGWMHFRDMTKGYPPMRVGQTTVHQLRWFGVKLRWESHIVEYDPPARFVDVQTRGPYRSWRHEHIFEEVQEGTLVTDHVRYSLPLGILGEIVHALIVNRQLRRIFDYRTMRLKERFAQMPEMNL
jgi:ligand-binding SRPBCC domain-containing protein